LNPGTASSKILHIRSNPLLESTPTENIAFLLREKMREHIHPGRCNSRIMSSVQARWAETLITKNQRDGIEWHKRKEVSHRNLLEPVVNLTVPETSKSSKRGKTGRAFSMMYSTTGPEK
jgi:hypothetical protein